MDYRDEMVLHCERTTNTRLSVRPSHQDREQQNAIRPSAVSMFWQWICVYHDVTDGGCLSFQFYCYHYRSGQECQSKANALR